jgi:hypothetical protein
MPGVRTHQAERKFAISFSKLSGWALPFPRTGCAPRAAYLVSRDQRDHVPGVRTHQINLDHNRFIRGPIAGRRRLWWARPGVLVHCVPCPMCRGGVNLAATGKKRCRHRKRESKNLVCEHGRKRPGTGTKDPEKQPQRRFIRGVQGEQHASFVDENGPRRCRMRSDLAVCDNRHGADSDFTNRKRCKQNSFRRSARKSGNASSTHSMMKRKGNAGPISRLLWFPGVASASRR